MELLTPNELSRILKLHPFTVTRLAREGKLPGFKVGGICLPPHALLRPAKQRGALPQGSV